MFIYFFFFENQFVHFSSYHFQISHPFGSEQLWKTHITSYFYKLLYKLYIYQYKWEKKNSLLIWFTSPKVSNSLVSAHQLIRWHLIILSQTDFVTPAPLLRGRPAPNYGRSDAVGSRDGASAAARRWLRQRRITQAVKQRRAL